MDSPRAAQPSAIEGTVGQIRQVINQKGEPYYQVVWLPGSMRPKVAWYHQSEITQITNQQASDVMNQINAGTYNPTTAQQQGSAYQQPNVPNPAIPPEQQTPGLATL